MTCSLAREKVLLFPGASPALRANFLLSRILRLRPCYSLGQTASLRPQRLLRHGRRPPAEVVDHVLGRSCGRSIIDMRMIRERSRLRNGCGAYFGLFVFFLRLFIVFLDLQNPRLSGWRLDICPLMGLP